MKDRETIAKPAGADQPLPHPHPPRSPPHPSSIGGSHFAYDPAKFGEKLQQLRKDRNLTQAKLAEKVGRMKPDVIRLYERGSRAPNPSTLEDLAKALKVSVQELLQGLPRAPTDPRTSCVRWQVVFSIRGDDLCVDIHGDRLTINLVSAGPTSTLGFVGTDEATALRLLGRLLGLPLYTHGTHAIPTTVLAVPLGLALRAHLQVRPVALRFGGEEVPCLNAFSSDSNRSSPGAQEDTLSGAVVLRIDEGQQEVEWQPPQDTVYRFEPDASVCEAWLRAMGRWFRQEAPDSDLPDHGVQELRGRERELDLLERCWRDPSVRVVVIVAEGGAGKTALALALARRIVREPGARVVPWSSYTQGVRTGSATPDQMLGKILSTTGDAWIAGGGLGDMAREVLSRMVNASGPTLLVLDGLETLCSPVGGEYPGRFRDPGVRSFFRRLTETPWGGLCVITTREPFHELEGWPGVERLPLSGLDGDAGLSILRDLGVHGPIGEMRDAVERLAGHALSLAVLATQLRDRYQGDIRHAEECGVSPRGRPGHRLQRVLTSYAGQLDASPHLRAAFWAVGLFDRPATWGELKELRDLRGVPNIPGQAGDWNETITRLGSTRLLWRNADGALDAHPLVRAFFGEEFRRRDRSSFIRAHEILYGYWSVRAPRCPADASETVAHYRALWHGFAAERYDEALDQIYKPRLWQHSEWGSGHWSVEVAGLSRADISVLNRCFEVEKNSTDWTRPLSALREDNQIFVLKVVGSALKAAGRMEEAIGAWRAAQAWHEERARRGIQGHMADVVECVAYRVDTMTWLGDLGAALADLETVMHSCQGVPDPAVCFIRGVAAMLIGHLCFRLGDKDRALREFEAGYEVCRGASEMHNEIYAIYDAGLRSYYGECLLEYGQFRKAQKVSEQALQDRGDNPCFGAQNRIVNLRARMHLGEMSAADELDKAVEDLRECKQEDYWVMGVIATAAAIAAAGKREHAVRNLELAREKAESCGMLLHLVDAEVRLGQLHSGERGVQHREKARKVASEIGYRLRPPELFDGRDTT